MMPVVPDVPALAVPALVAARQERCGAAGKAGWTARDLASGAVGAVSNLGARGVDAFTGIVPAGRRLLLTTGRIAVVPVAVDGRLAVRTTLIATLNVDHRYLDGDRAADVLYAFDREFRALHPGPGKETSERSNRARRRASRDANRSAGRGASRSAAPATRVLRDWLDDMLLIRQFEHEGVRLSFAGNIPGGIHSSEGQEAVAVGTVAALEPLDVVVRHPPQPSPRAGQRSLAAGGDGRAVRQGAGLSQGRGGSMHLVDAGRRFLGTNGIVGPGLGLAMGAALGMKLQGQPLVAVGFFGDGGANTGRVWEFINMAALWKLPLIAICENNLYAVETHISASLAGGSVADRAAGFGLPAETVDGQDVVAVHEAMRRARARGRRRWTDVPRGQDLPLRGPQRR